MRLPHYMQVAVDDDSSYLFNVAMMDARNFTSVYSGTNVSFTSTDYQDCVADPDCTSQVQINAAIKRVLVVYTNQGRIFHFIQGCWKAPGASPKERKQLSRFCTATCCPSSPAPIQLPPSLDAPPRTLPIPVVAINGVLSLIDLIECPRETEAQRGLYDNHDRLRRRDGASAAHRGYEVPAHVDRQGHARHRLQPGRPVLPRRGPRLVRRQEDSQG